MTHTSTEQERAEFTDGAWYWVEKEGWHGEPPIIAPAMYKADCKAWYSHGFGGISTCFLKVLEPCTRGQQAARRAPAPQAHRVPLTDAQIHDWWRSENSLEDCDMCRFADFAKVVRAFELKYGITQEKQG